MTWWWAFVLGALGGFVGAGVGAASVVLAVFWIVRSRLHRKAV